ncbi:Metallophos domain-containing protein [Meloidogyne graminicola]|uniref:Metallophos domain-containing protein n=1 Tax=Meloidogyne graminicola TaxID=189291 RepID=A0A8S9ZDG4_9BILA|nr:Metallophos domain-containing protein [Meloidogyne graminicola]
MAFENGIIRADPMSHRPVELWKKYLRQVRVCNCNLQFALLFTTCFTICIGRNCEPAKVLRLDTPIHPDKVRFVCISDTHEKMDEVLDLIPDGDILIHAGDFTEAGDVSSVIKFNQQIGKLPHKVKIVIAGNHELGFEDGEEMSDRQLAGLSMLGIGKAYELLTNCIYLCDRLIEKVFVYGIKIYGAPWHPMPGYSFYRQRGQALLQKWNQIPSKTDVLITHTPPLGHGDFNSWTKLGGMLAGCAVVYFFNIVQLVAKYSGIPYHVFGHIHQQHGCTTNGVTTFINASTCDHKLRTEYDPIIFDIPLPYGRSKDELYKNQYSIFLLQKMKKIEYKAGYYFS